MLYNGDHHLAREVYNQVRNIEEILHLTIRSGTLKRSSILSGYLALPSPAEPFALTQNSDVIFNFQRYVAACSKSHAYFHMPQKESDNVCSLMNDLYC